MTLTQPQDYAVRALVDLAHHPGSRVGDVAQRTAVPSAHLSKVIQALARAGLVETTRGRRGGVRLARDATEIQLRQILEAMQGPIRFLRCPRREQGCHRNTDCAIYCLWLELQKETTLRLEGVYLSDLLQTCAESA
jgi:Rrf2 family protein